MSPQPLQPGDKVGDGDGAVGTVVKVEIERRYDAAGRLTKHEQIFVDWGAR